ncbi:MAG TPA: hypothetical protein VFZ65_18700 [Planctomycetota bacterium]|nr:hypothetical protein [Planctomycetota bacterium]
MRIPRTCMTSLAATLLVAALVPAQGGGRGRNRPEEIQNRVGVYFSDIAGPATEGDKVADLNTCELVRAAAAANQVTVLYLYDSSDDRDVRETFERALFGSDEMGIQLRCFHCGRIDLAKDEALKAKYIKQAPLFVVFDKDAKPSDISMNGYKVAGNGLEKLLEKAAQGVVKPSLASFAKEYGGFVRDMEQLLNKKKLATTKQAKAGADKGKRLEAEKDLKVVEGEEQKLLAKEKELLEKVKLPERPADAQRLGDRGWGGGGGRGGQGGGGQGGGGQGGSRNGG